MSQKDLTTQEENDEAASSTRTVTEAIDALRDRSSSRRHFLAQAGLAGLGVLAAGQAGASAFPFRSTFPIPAGLPVGRGNGQGGGQGGGQNGGSDNFANVSDIDVLNFALNLEYLEAEFYVRAAYGTTLGSSDISGRGNDNRAATPGAVIGFSATPTQDKVPFANTTQDQIIRQYAQEIATDELTHVRLLRGALGSSAVARPTLDIGPAFTAAARAAGVVGPTGTFNPYADPVSFLLGAFIFEDVGVTAYRGALSLLSDRGRISVAGGLLGVEAYHASEVRTVLFGIARSTNNVGIIDAVQKISNLRDAADGAGDSDQGITNNDTDQSAVVGTGVSGEANIVPTDANGLVYARTLRQVLSIVYLGGTASGGFLPNGLNGRVR